MHFGFELLYYGFVLLHSLQSDVVITTLPAMDMQLDI